MGALFDRHLSIESLAGPWNLPSGGTSESAAKVGERLHEPAAEPFQIQP
jgi:hypothetical protein